MALIETVAPEKAEGDIEKAYSVFMNTIGVVPKPFQMLSVSPELMKIQRQLIDYYMNHPNLGFTLLTLIRFLVSREYSYQFCIDFNQNLLEMQGMEEDEISKVVSDPGQAPLDEEEKALLLFVLKAIKSPDAVTEKDVDALHQLGWIDTDIFDAVYHGTGMIPPSIMMKAFKV